MSSVGQRESEMTDDGGNVWLEMYSQRTAEEELRAVGVRAICTGGRRSHKSECTCP